MLKLFVGLGNPGKKHENDRHNAGFMALDALQKGYDFSAKRKSNRFHGFYAKGSIGDFACLLLWPQTYMNRSGLAVDSVMRYYSVSIDDILVFHDDIDLPFGALRVKWGGSDGGHLGLRDIDKVLKARGGNGYGRVRLGIGRALADDCNKEEGVNRHVLSAFSSPQRML